MKIMPINVSLDSPVGILKESGVLYHISGTISNDEEGYWFVLSENDVFLPIHLPNCKNVAEATQAAKEMYVKLNQYFHAVMKNSTVFLSTDQEKIQQAIRENN